jgi:hypothetical protein
VERLLRVQVFNKAFEGFDHYSVTIVEEQAQADGLREVTVVASGKFLDRGRSGDRRAGVGRHGLAAVSGSD